MASATPADSQHHTTRTATEATPSFLGVPAELFERFAQFAEPKDLLALRLTCRDAAAKVLRTYTEVHFSHRHILLSEETNLRIAIDVAQHPVFGGALKKLSIHLVEIRYRSDFEGTDPGTYWMSDENYRDHIDRIMQLKPKYEEQKMFQEKRLDLFFLRILFAQTRIRSARPEMLLCSREDEQHCRLRIDDDRCNGWSYYYGLDLANRPFMVVMKALSLENLNISSLRATRGSHFDGFRLHVNRLFSDDLVITAEALRSIKRLEIEMGFDMYRAPSTNWAFRFQDLAETLASTPVEVLSLRFAVHYSDVSLIRKQFIDQRFEKLLKLNLMWGAGPEPLSMSELVRFIRRQPVLQELYFGEIHEVMDVPQDLLLDRGRENLEAALEHYCGLAKVGIAWAADESESGESEEEESESEESEDELEVEEQPDDESDKDHEENDA